MERGYSVYHLLSYIFSMSIPIFTVLSILIYIQFADRCPQRNDAGKVKSMRRWVGDPQPPPIHIRLRLPIFSPFPSPTDYFPSEPRSSSLMGFRMLSWSWNL